MCTAYAHCCFSIADESDEDGARPELDLYLKAERLLSDLVTQMPDHDETRGYFVYVQRRLAEEHDARGDIQDAAN
jgi:hypothetical protein